MMSTGKRNAALLLCLVSLGLSQLLMAACKVSEGVQQFALNDAGWNVKKECNVITLENERVIVQVAPDADGNVIRIADKTKTDTPFCRLDDNFSSTGSWQGKPYTYRIEERGPNRAAVTLLGSGTLTPWVSGTKDPAVPAELTIQRTMSIDAKSSCVRIDMKITNAGQAVIPAFRYMAHAVYTYKFLPGGTVYTYLPLENGVRIFDYDRIVKDKFLAAHMTDGNPFLRWSKPGTTIDKARYAANGWMAMYSDSGYSYLFYDPAQFNFVSLWVGTHPAEWLTLEPNTKAIDLKPGGSVAFSYTFASDARDVPLKGKTLIYEPPTLPTVAVQGSIIPFIVRATTVRDMPEQAKVQLVIQQKKRTLVKLPIQWVVNPFLPTELPANCPLPKNMKPGMYTWTATDATGKKLATGNLEIISQQEADKRANVHIVANTPEDTEAFPQATWTNALGIQFVRIPAGEFLMGSANDDAQASPDEKPQHKVRITQTFLMAKYEVTNEQFRKFRADYSSGKDNIHDLHSLKPVDLTGDQQPVVVSSWYYAKEFCKWLNEHDTTKPAGWEYRFPTEAEWEYAARGPQDFRYPWGNVWDSTRCKFGDQTGMSGFAGTTPVGSFSPKGDSPFGICDMAGNLYEWCEDYYNPTFYTNSPVDDPLCTAGTKDYEYEGSINTYRVARGGGWGSLPGACRTTYRYSVFGTSAAIHGIRLVLVPVAEKK